MQDNQTLRQALVPPQALDFEEAILGNIMSNRNSLLAVIDTLKADFFYTDPNQKIYKAITELFSASQPVDMLTVSEQLRKNGDLELVGGLFYLMKIADVKTVINVAYYAKIIEQKFISRQLISISTETISESYTDATDVLELVEKTQGKIFSLVSSNYGRDVSVMNDLVLNRLNKYQEPVTNGLTGVGSGFKSFDKITSGFQPSDLIILAARPGMGKTAAALNFAKNAAITYGEPVAVFSLEMSEEQLTDRMISSETDIHLERILKRNFYAGELERMSNSLVKLASAPLFIDDTPSLSINGLRAKAIRLKSLHGLKMIVVDYLQLMTGNSGNKNGNREQEISTISRGLKALAKELNIPVIALSQLSRQVESRPDKRPMLSDLRESGAIEQDADMILFLYRPEYYGLTEDAEGRSTGGIAELIIGKHRNGVCDTINLQFNGAKMRFKDLEEAFEEDKPSALQPSETFDVPSNFTIQPSRTFEDEPF